MVAVVHGFHSSAPVLAGFDDRIVFFGLQGFIQDMLINTWNAGFFNRPNMPLAKTSRRVAVFLQKLGERQTIFRDQ